MYVHVQKPIYCVLVACGRFLQTKVQSFHIFHILFQFEWSLIEINTLNNCFDCICFNCILFGKIRWKTFVSGSKLTLPIPEVKFYAECFSMILCLTYQSKYTNVSKIKFLDRLICVRKKLAVWSIVLHLLLSLTYSCFKISLIMTYYACLFMQRVIW